MMSRGTEEFAPLVSNQEQNGNAEHYYDMEHMSTEEAPKKSNVEHEYSISPGIRFTWLGTYFVFSLMLTMYNKLVLGVVSSLPRTKMCFPRLQWIDVLKVVPLVPFFVASDLFAHFCIWPWHISHDATWIL